MRGLSLSFLFQIIPKINILHPIPTTLVKLRFAREFGDWIVLAHLEPFFIDAAFAVFPHKLAGENKVPKLVFALDIKPFIRRVEKLHYLKLFFAVCVHAVHIIETFSAPQTLARYPVGNGFWHEVR